jgi:hypothetical protein
MNLGFMMNTMKDSRTETVLTSKRWRPRFWIGCFSLLLGLPLLYYGYCWGLLGRHSLLLQYLFQCSCPPASEEARYPDDVDVIVPACRNVDIGVRLSPSGRFLYFREEKNGLASAYFLDLQTMESITVTNQPFSSFITDDLWFVESGLDDDIIDRTTGKQYPIQTFRNWRENAYVNGEPNLELLVSALREAEQVFLTPNYSTVVVLMPNFLIKPEQNFTFSLFDFPEWSSNQVEQFLQENNIVYQTISVKYPHEVLSANGNLMARDDGIYLVETNRMIAKVPLSLVMGWTSDGRGAIYSSSGLCLLRLGIPIVWDESFCYIRVPQPVLLLKVPQEFLLPTELP